MCPPGLGNRCKKGNGQHWGWDLFTCGIWGVEVALAHLRHISPPHCLRMHIWFLMIFRPILLPLGFTWNFVVCVEPRHGYNQTRRGLASRRSSCFDFSGRCCEVIDGGWCGRECQIAITTRMKKRWMTGWCGFLAQETLRRCAGIGIRILYLYIYIFTYILICMWAVRSSSGSGRLLCFNALLGICVAVLRRYGCWLGRSCERIRKGCMVRCPTLSIEVQISM